VCNGFGYNGKEGVATSIGHSPVAALLDPVSGSRTAIAEALSNIVWALSKAAWTEFHFGKLDVGL
jgi:phosphoribosylformylglycinamidine (FGAM) synthase-like enzyme